MNQALSPENHLLAPVRTEMLINGQWQTAADEKRFEVYNPANGQVIARVPQGGAADVERAVSAARAAFDGGWRDMLPAMREALLLKFAGLVEAHGEELARLETLNQGKLLPFAQAIDVGATVQWLRYMAGWATKIEGSALDISFPLPPGARYQVMVKRPPVGVVGAIVPWNFPMLMAIWKIAPALACGCTVVLKPAEETPLTALRLAELALEAGIPPGVLNVVTGDGSTGAALVRHPGVDKITFTGSTEVGKEIGRQCAADVRRVTLELGGKSPVLILPDCDPALAVEGAANAIFFNHGQVCTAGSRLYVHTSQYARVLDGIATIASRTVLGSGFDAAAQMGPMVSARHLERVQSLIATGVEEGAEMVAGGHADMQRGYFVRPTVFGNPSCRPLTLLEQEVFGPVLVVQPYDEIDEAIHAANHSQFGLGASVWTQNLSLALRTSEKLQAGTVWINAHNVVDPNMPFGGFKQSGIGREHGRAAIDAYTESKSVCIAY